MEALYITTTTISEELNINSKKKPSLDRPILNWFIAPIIFR